MNITVQLEFELAYYNVWVQYVNHYTTGTPSEMEKDKYESTETDRYGEIEINRI